MVELEIHAADLGENARRDYQISVQYGNYEKTVAKK
jgi:hypothetical protein